MSQKIGGLNINGVQEIQGIPGTQGMKHKLVDASEIEKSGGMIYDPSEGEPNLVDVDMMLDQIAKVLEAMMEDEMFNLKETSPSKYEEKMEEKFPEFALRYYAVFKKVISGEDITPLFEMLLEIEKIHKGDKSLEQVEKELGEEYANKYIYPKINNETKKKKKNKHKKH